MTNFRSTATRRNRAGSRDFSGTAISKASINRRQWSRTGTSPSRWISGMSKPASFQILKRARAVGAPPGLAKRLECGVFSLHPDGAPAFTTGLQPHHPAANQSDSQTATKSACVVLRGPVTGLAKSLHIHYPALTR